VYKSIIEIWYAYILNRSYNEIYTFIHAIYSKQTVTNMNIWCFMLKDINIILWEKLLNQLCISDNTNSNINYLLISLKTHNTVIMGYIQCSVAIDIIHRYLVNLIGFYNIDSWNEANDFIHLSLCHTMIHSIL
jgi:hypothetical protein